METTDFCMAIAERAIDFVNDSCSFESETEEESKKLRDKTIASTAALFLYKEVEKIYLGEIANLIEMAKMFAERTEMEDVDDPTGLPSIFCDIISGKTKEELPGIIEKYNNFMDYIDGRKLTLEEVLEEVEFDNDGTVC